MVDITPQIETSQTEPILGAAPKIGGPVGTDPPAGRSPMSRPASLTRSRASGQSRPATAGFTCLP